jgi:hypothetical protein
LDATVGMGAAVRGARLAVNAIRASGKIAKATAWAGRAGRAIKSAAGAARRVWNNGFVRSGASCLLPDNSFAPDSRVVMADGTLRAIADIDVGDLVLAVDPQTGVTTSEPVLDVIVGQGTRHLIDIDVDGGTSDVLTATAQHPLWVEGKGWQDAEDVHAGDVVARDGAGAVRVSSVVDRGWIPDQVVYNLNVGAVHTYVVEVDGQAVLAHNRAAGPRRCLPGNTRWMTTRFVSNIRQGIKLQRRLIDRMRGRGYTCEARGMCSSRDHIHIDWSRGRFSGVIHIRWGGGRGVD